MPRPSLWHVKQAAPEALRTRCSSWRCSLPRGLVSGSEGSQLVLGSSRCGLRNGVTPPATQPSVRYAARYCSRPVQQAKQAQETPVQRLTSGASVSFAAQPVAASMKLSASFK